MGKVAALILAGGKGTRMDMLCEYTPKPLLSFGGLFRVIDFSLSNCIHSEISEYAILTNHGLANIERYLRNWHVKNSGPCIMNILEPEFKSYKGTADAIFQNLEYLNNIEADTILVLAADHVYKMDYRDLVNFHLEVDADVTLGVIEVPINKASRFGICRIDGENRIVKYQEKPEKPWSNLASMGIYAFKKETLIERIHNYGSCHQDRHDVSYTIIPEILEKDRFFAYQFDGYWRDIGTVEAFYNTSMEMLGTPEFLITDAKWPVLTGDSRLRMNDHIPEGNVSNSIVSQECIVKGKVINSVLSPGVKINSNALVKDSILMPEVKIGNFSVVDHCIIDEYANIGDYSYIGFGDTHMDGSIMTILGKSSIIPSGTVIGRNCRILPDVRLEDFTSACFVPSGRVIGQSISLESTIRV